MRAGVQLFLIGVRKVLDLLLFHLSHHLAIPVSLNYLLFLHHHPLYVIYFFPLDLKVILVLVILIALLAFHIKVLRDLLVLRLYLLRDLVCLVLNIALIIFNHLHLLADALNLQLLRLHLLLNFLKLGPDHRLFTDKLGRKRLDV